MKIEALLTDAIALLILKELSDLVENRGIVVESTPLRKIEAQGIADFQKIVSERISDPLLKWKGIEATEKLAESHNTKVVIIGGWKNGLPII